MPFYPLKKISLLAETRQAYLRGVSGYNTGWVQDYTSAPNPFYPEYIKAQAVEGDNSYHVEVGFDEGEQAEYLECSCGQFHPGEGACKHIVAVLVHKYYRDMIDGLPTAAQLMNRPGSARTDPAAQQLIDQYMSRETLRLTAAGAAGQAVLTPVLDLTGIRPAVSFTVGIDRPYVIKNLTRFAERMLRRETAEYGKQLRLLHHPDSFAPASRPLLGFLLGELGDRQNQPGTLTAAGSAGQLVLSPAGFERLFSLLLGSRVTLREPEGERQILLAEGDPVLTVTVEKEQDGLRLWSEEARPISGVETLYLLHRGTLYRTGEEYTRRMSEWVRTGRRAANGLYIAPAQLPAFCAGVLETVRPFIRLEGEEALLRTYTPKPLQAEIWLDAPDAFTVTARVVYRYGDRRVEPYSGAPEPADLHRDTLKELRVKLALEAQFTALQPDTGLLVLHGDDERLFDFITRGVDALRRVATVYASEDFDRLLPATPPRITIGVSLVSDLLQMDVELEDLDPEELSGILTGYRENRTYHRLRDGRFVQLEAGMLADLAELAEGLGLTQKELRSGCISLPKYRALYLEQILRRQQETAVSRDEAFRGLTERCRQAAQKDWPVPDSLRSVLRGYQKAGYRWLRTMEEVGFGGILADDMGLGKTVQVIALLLAAKESGTAKAPSLVVCPTSVVLNWEREIARFAPALSVLCVIGDAAQRRERLERVNDYDVIITSYDMLKRDVESYAPLQFHYHVLDEAQYIKNSSTQNARAAKAVRAAQRFALTGTPVENRLSELWSIFDFLMPGLLFSYPKFRTRYELPILRGEDERALNRLSRLVSPFILRRLKQEVLAELPPKTERVLPATMERPQRQVYLAAIAQLKQQLLAAGGSRLGGQSRITVLAMLTRLRQICCDPRLCCDGYTGDSCKLEACVELLREATAGGHKVLLFSQFTSMLELLRQRLEAEGISHYILQGSTPKEERARLVDAFNSDDTPVFLISLKAGGTGLNLTGADMVIHYDPWWNLAAQNQATDRAHRIGQKNPVQVVRLIARDTIEDKILQMQESKWQLAQAVVDTGGPSLTDLSVAELLELLE